MISRIFVLMLAALACCVLCASATPQPIVTEPDGMDLSAANLQISSPDHSAEYLQKTGGAIQPSMEGYYRDLAGEWTIKLVDQRSRPVGTLELQLYQFGAVIFGKGIFKEGLNKEIVTAEGSLASGNAMVLNAVTVENTNLYRLAVNSVDGNNTSGTFARFATDGSDPVKGTISGGRSGQRKLS